MNKDEVSGKTDQVKGRAKQAWGDVTKNERIHDEGVADEAAGKVEEGFGKARRKVGEAVKDLGDQIKK
ncbi:MAG TPA: CsbD family protein [Vicinamibacterales bacterium]|nr:CsbD family protein [Vicinamibacterales bacterium]